MTTDDSRTRRNYLRTLSTAGAVVGGSLIGVSTASARDRSGGRDPTAADPAEIQFEAVCADSDDDAALFRVENETEQSLRLEWRATPVEAGIEYLDCQTIRVVGDFAEVLVDATFLTDAGVGNVIRDFGPVDGSAVFDIRDPDGIPADSIVADVDAFREGTPVVPGGGDISAANPNDEACQRDVFGEVIDAASTGGASETARSADEGDSSGRDCERTELVVPPNATRWFAASGGDGLVSVALFADDERIATASSAAAEPCSIPSRWWRRLR